MVIGTSSERSKIANFINFNFVCLFLHRPVYLLVFALAGKPSAYDLGFASGKSLVRLHNSLGSCESILGKLPRGQFYLPTPAAFTLFILDISDKKGALEYTSQKSFKLYTTK